MLQNSCLVYKDPLIKKKEMVCIGVDVNQKSLSALSEIILRHVS